MFLPWFWMILLRGSFWGKLVQGLSGSRVLKLWRGLALVFSMGRPWFPELPAFVVIYGLRSQGR